MTGFNMGLPGNGAANALAGRSVPVEEAQYLSRMAVAFEQRTANLIAWHGFVSAQGDLPDETALLAKQIEARLPLS